jgi:site-specific recombinase XerD
MLYPIDMIYADIYTFVVSSNLAEATRELHRHYLMLFFGWTMDNQIPLEKITNADVMTWFRDNPNWTASTKHNAASALRKFFSWKFGESHSVCSIKVKRVDAGPQRVLDEHELIAILSAIDTSTAKGVRDLAITTLMADTGMRASEICHLETRYLDLKTRKLRVLVKGGDYNVKYFFEYTASCLANWMAIRKTYARPSTPTVFVAIGGKKPGLSMTRSALKTICNTLARDARLEHFSPHSFRRSFATIATENGAPSRLIQAAGGWKSIRMVERYTRTVKAEKLAPYSPVNRVMGFEAEEG